MAFTRYFWRNGDGNWSDPNHWENNTLNQGPPAGPPGPGDEALLVAQFSVNQAAHITAADLVINKLLLSNHTNGQALVQLDASSLSIIGQVSQTSSTGAASAGVSDNTIFNILGAVLVDGPTRAQDSLYRFHDGNLTVSGYRSPVTPAVLNAGSITVGDVGAGQLFTGSSVGSPAPGRIEVSGPLIFGNQSGSIGELSMQGTGDRLIVHSDVVIGNGGTGIVRVLTGTTFDASGQTVTLGSQLGATGELNLFSSMDIGNVIVGNAGTGRVSIFNGAQATVTGAVRIGTESTGSGTLTVGDTTSGTAMLSVNGLMVGDGGAATAIVRNGALLLADSVTIGDEGTGTLTVDGAGSILQTAHLTVGGAVPIDHDEFGNWTYEQGTGTLNVTNGGSIVIDGDLTLRGRVMLDDDGVQIFEGGIFIGDGSSLVVGDDGVAAAKLYQLNVGPPATMVVGPGVKVTGHGAVRSSSSGADPQGAPIFSLQADLSEIQAKDGLLVIQGDIFNNDSHATISDFSALEFGGQFEGTVLFDDSDPSTGAETLILDRPDVFKGKLEGMAADDTIILRNVHPDKDYGVIAVSIGKLDGEQTLQILLGTDATHVTQEFNIPIQGDIDIDEGNLDKYYFQVIRSENDKNPEVQKLANSTVLKLKSPELKQIPAVVSHLQPDDSDLGRVIKVGILSDSFKALPGYELDVLTNWLPPDVKILRDAISGLDEGRAMAQIVHAIAPQAKLDFYSVGNFSFPNPVLTAAAILALKADGCSVIVDDVNGNWLLSYTSPAGVALINDAIEAVVQSGVTYVTSAGNERNIAGGPYIRGHDGHSSAITVAAVDYLAAPQQLAGASELYPLSNYWMPAATEPFSSLGRPGSGKPDIAGLDGVQTSFPLQLNATFPRPNGGGLNPFFGTSAAAPEVAAVAALMLQVNPQLSPVQIKDFLKQTAVSAGFAPAEGTDHRGAGVVWADGAIALAIAERVAFYNGPSQMGPIVGSAMLSQPDGNLNIGSAVQLMLSFNSNLAITGGIPMLTLNNGAMASYNADSSNLPAGNLVFDYTVAAGQQIANLAVTDVSLNGATVQDSNGVNADFSALFNLPTGLSINSPLVVTHIASSQIGVAHPGQTVALSLTLTEGVTVDMGGGLPTLALNNGAVATYNAAASSPAASLLTFDYTVGANESTPNLSVFLVNLPNGTTVRDGNGNNADFEGALNELTDLQIGPAFVTGVFASPFGAAHAGQTVEISLVISEGVLVDTSGGSPTLTLNSDVTAIYDASASDLPAGYLVFDYLVGSNDDTVDLDVTQINLNGANLYDDSGVAIDFSSALNFPIGLSINSPLAATAVSASRSGNLQIGETIQLTLTMNGSVFDFFGGLPGLLLNNGGVATYNREASDPTGGLLVYDYTVGAAEHTNDLVITNVTPLQSEDGYNADFFAVLNVGLGVAVGGGSTTVGGPSDDTVFGVPGADVLVGGAGADRFLFGSPMDGTDTITDFSVEQGDKVVFNSAGFGLSGFGSLAAAGVDFVPGHVSRTTVATVLAAGSDIYFDADGTGPAAAVLLAHVGTATQNLVANGDFNGDGSEDLLWRTADGTTFTWLMNPSPPPGIGFQGPLPSTLGFELAATGDFNGDHIVDLVWRNPSNGQTVTWLMSSDGVSAQAALPSTLGYSLIAHGDFDGDGITDLMWKHDASGQTIAWLMSPTGAIASDAALSSTAGYGMLVAGDFNGDGHTDAIWKNVATGETIVWRMFAEPGLNKSDAALSSTAGYNLVASGDFNADGHADTIWKETSTGNNVAWLMFPDQNSNKSDAALSSTQGYSKVAEGDLNGDGTIDVLWRHDTTGETIAWLINAMPGKNKTDVAVSNTLGYSVVASGDFDGNGTTDIMWRHNASGDVIEWLMAKTTLGGVGFQAALPNTAGRSVLTTGDFNGDHTTDVIWERAADGATEEWIAAAGSGFNTFGLASTGGIGVVHLTQDDFLVV